jgi:hypothetical protein
MRANLFVSPVRRAAATICLAVIVGLAGCGGGEPDVVVVVPPPPPVAALDLVLTRVGPEAVQLDWSDDPAAASFVVYRNGSTLAHVDAVSLVDASVQFNGRYCYAVDGYDRAGVLVSASETACITIIP